jgi:VWFA-related protein
MMMRTLLAFLAVGVLLAQSPQRPQPGQLAPGTPRTQPGQPAPGQAQAPAEDSDLKIVSTTTVVVAPTTVLDKHGDYVDGLQPSDFTLYDNGKVQKIDADVSFEPISLVLAVQASYSLNDILPKIQRIGNEVNDLIVGAGGEMAVVAFDHRIQTLQPFTDDGAKVSAALKRLSTGGSSHRMIDAVEESVRMLKRRPTDHRRIILLISEKRDSGSEARLRETLTQAELQAIAIYAIDISHLAVLATGQAMPPRPDPIPAAAQHLPGGGASTPTTLDQLHNTGNFIPMFVEIFKGVKSIFIDDHADVFTRYTGGKEFSFLSQKSLERAVSALGQEIHHQYLLSYKPNNLAEGGFHEIRVDVNRPGLEIRTRPGYWKAPEPTAQQ